MNNWIKYTELKNKKYLLFLTTNTHDGVLRTHYPEIKHLVVVTIFNFREFEKNGRNLKVILNSCFPLPSSLKQVIKPSCERCPGQKGTSLSLKTKGHQDKSPDL